MHRSGSLPRADYKALKRTAALKPKTDEQRLEVLDAQAKLLNLGDWKGKTLFLKKQKDMYSNTTLRLSKSRSFRDVFTGKDRAKTDEVQKFLVDEFAKPLETHTDPTVRARAKELSAALENNRELIDDTRPKTARYFGETDNHRVLRDAISGLSKAYAAFMKNKATGNMAAADGNGKGDAQPLAPPLADGQAIPQPVAPSNAADKPVSLWGHYPDPVCCGMAGDGPRLLDPAVRKAAASAVYGYLTQQPPVPNGVAYMAVDSQGQRFFGVRPSDASIAPETAEEQRRELVRFVYSLCDAIALDDAADRNTCEYATRLRYLVGTLLNDKKDLPNSPNLAKAFARLGGIPPQAAPAAAVAMVDANKPERFHTTASSAAAVLKSLPPLSPETQTHVLRTVVRDGALYVEAVPPRNDPLKGSKDPADLLTCRLIDQLGSDAMKSLDPQVREVGAKLQEIARRSRTNNIAITNHRGLHVALAVVSGAQAGASEPPQEAPARRQEPAPARNRRREDAARQPSPSPVLRAKNNAPRVPRVVAQSSPFGAGTFIPSKHAPQLVLDSLLDFPPTHELRTVSAKNSSVYVEAVAPVIDGDVSRRGSADSLTIGLFRAMANEYTGHTSELIRRRAQELMAVAEASEKNNLAIRNLAGLHEILRDLAGAAQPARKEAPRPGPVANNRAENEANRSGARGRTVTTLYAATRQNTYATARNATARELLRMLKEAPSTHVLHTQPERDQAVTSTRLPGKPKVQPEGNAPRANTLEELSIKATRDFLWALVKDFRDSEDEAVKRAMVGILNIIKVSTEDQRPIPNTPELQGYLSTLASAR